MRFLAAGREYNISLFSKLGLLKKMRRNTSQPGSATLFFEHVYIVTRLLSVPKATEGVVGEFGCFNGFSTATLSLACAMTGRRLVVFDSFEGLPEPESTVHNFDTGQRVQYQKGQYAGTLETVRENVTRFGNVAVCEFVKGYFDETLPRRDEAEKFVMIFEDADLPQSVKSVLTGAWKKLQPNGTFFSHEARDREVVDLFFDRQWWSDNIGEPAPGFAGSGVGILGGPFWGWCYLGYAMRRLSREQSSRLG